MRAFYVGMNGYIFPFMGKRDKESFARSPLPDVPRTGGGGVEKPEKKSEGKKGAGGAKRGRAERGE